MSQATGRSKSDGYQLENASAVLVKLPYSEQLR